MAFNKEREAAASNYASKEDKPKTKIWINIGYDSKDEETGEPLFISTPFGLGVDTMNKQEEPNGKNKAFLRLVRAKNELLEYLQKYAEALEPGEAQIITDLKIQIRRIEEPTQDSATEENPHRSALSQLGFVKALKAA